MKGQVRKSPVIRSTRVVRFKSEWIIGLWSLATMDSGAGGQ